MNTAIIKKWSITTNENGYKAPEFAKPQLCGEIFEDSRNEFPDGTSVTTSVIRKIIEHGTHKSVHMLNTQYKVYPADVDPDYEKQYPGAYSRLEVV